jgi:hypothetical protein
VPAEHGVVELAVQPVRVTAYTAVVPVVDRVDAVNERAVNPGMQLMIRTIAAQHFNLDAVPLVG